MTGGQSVVITDTFASAGLEIPDAVGSLIRRLKGFDINRRSSSTHARPSMAPDRSPASRFISHIDQPRRG